MFQVQSIFGECKNVVFGMNAVLVGLVSEVLQFFLSKYLKDVFEVQQHYEVKFSLFRICTQ